MAMTHTERATLYSALAGAIGEREAGTLMEQFPPSGWDQVATKDDLRVLGAAFASGLAETNAALTAGLAETNAALTAGLAEISAALTAGLAEAAKERAEIVRSVAGIEKSQAGLLRSQARQLYVITSTIIAATVSIWIALLTGAGPR